MSCIAASVIGIRLDSQNCCINGSIYVLSARVAWPDKHFASGGTCAGSMSSYPPPAIPLHKATRLTDGVEMFYILVQQHQRLLWQCNHYAKPYIVGYTHQWIVYIFTPAGSTTLPICLHLKRILARLS